MKVSLEHIKYDVNSTERKPLSIMGVDAGTFSFGLYSKWYLSHKELNFPFSLVGNYVLGLLEKEFKTDLSTKDKVEEFVKSFKGNIAEWFEGYMSK